MIEIRLFHDIGNVVVACYSRVHEGETLVAHVPIFADQPDTVLEARHEAQRMFGAYDAHKRNLH